MATNCSTGVNEDAYQHIANKDRVQEVTAENIYTNMPASERRGSTENTSSKKNSKKMTTIKLAVLSMALVLLFGLALCGVLLVSKEKLRLDETKIDLRVDMQKYQNEANATWEKKISELETQNKKTSEKFLRVLQDYHLQHNITNQKLMADIQESAVLNKQMIRDREIVQNSTHDKLVEDRKQQVSQLKKEIEAKITQSTDGLNRMISELNLAQRKLVKEIKFMMPDAGWHKASNGLYYRVFKIHLIYTEARAQCQQRGARLVSTGLRDLSVRGELVKIMKDTGENVWIGANDITTERTFVWENGVTSNGRDIDWAENQPDNSGNEDCLHAYKDHDWKVNDIDCGRTFIYMCEKDVGN